jgi:hypothetical protein
MYIPVLVPCGSHLACTQRHPSFIYNSSIVSTKPSVSWPPSSFECVRVLNVAEIPKFAIPSHPLSVAASTKADGFLRFVHMMRDTELHSIRLTRLASKAQDPWEQAPRLEPLDLTTAVITATTMSNR